MKKIFVPLDSKNLPAEDPIKIRTWNIKNEEEINPGTYALEEKELDDMYKFPRPFPKKKPCKPKKSKKNKNEIRSVYPIEPTEIDKKPEYLNYVKPQLKIEEQKENAIAREDIIRIKEKQGMCYNVMTSPRTSFTHGKKLIQVPSPIFNGEVEPIPASRQASECIPDIPKPSLIKLKLPQSGVFINETNVKQTSADPCPYYNPRILQEKLDTQDVIYTIIDKKGKLVATTNKHAEHEPIITSKDMSTQKYLCEDSRPRCFDNGMITYNIENPKEILEAEDHKNIPVDLGFPVGILFGTLNINNPRFSDCSRSKQGLACIYVAFGYIYIIPENKWNIQVIDDILTIGDKLYLSSTTNPEQPVKDEEINKKFQIMGMNIEVEVSLPLIFGQLKSNDPKMPHLYKGLCIFFRLHKRCMFKCKTTCFLICKKCDSFYIFDPDGRDEKCLRDKENGFANLLSVKTLENVANLIIYFSELKKDYLYVLYKIRMLTLLKDEKKQELIKNCEKINECHYNIINKHRATILGTLTVDTCEDTSKAKYALSICCLTMVYAVIDPPISWSPIILDKLVALGNQFFKDCVKYDTSLDFAIKDVPEIFTFGPYYAEITLKPCLYKGEITETEELEDNEMMQALELFIEKHNSAIIEIGTCFFSFWRQNNVFYLYDPYARNNIGEIPNENSSENAACLNMHSTLDSLCEVFVNNLCNLGIKSQFYIHLFKISDVIKLTTNQYRTDLNTYSSLNKQIRFIDSIECLKDHDELHEVKAEIHNYDSDVDLDSTNVSETQFMPKWNIIKEDIFELPMESCIDINKSTESLNRCPSRVPLCDLSVLTVVEKSSESSLLEEAEEEEEEYEEDEAEEEVEEEVEEEQEIESEIFHDPDALQIVNEIIDQIFLETFNKIWEKCCKETGVPYTGPDEAKEILLKSDLNYLERLQNDLIHGKDYDNIDEAFRRFAPPKVILTLSQELLVESNFDELPDGSYIISGKHNLLKESKDPECMVAIIGIAAIITSYKYSIHTWDSNMVDFVFQTASVICRIIPESKRISILFTKPKHTFPRLKIGSQIFSCNMHKIAQGTYSDLYNMLEKSFTKIDRVLVLTSTYSFAVFKRKNFYYLYEGNPCNFVGFRVDTEPGVSCFLRFNSLSHLVRRANCNKNDLNDAHSTVISRLIIKDVTREGSNKYEVVNPSQENVPFDRKYRDAENYEHEKMLKDAKDKRFKDKMKFLKSEIDAEKKRLKKFEEKKNASNKAKKQASQKVRHDNSEEEDESEEETELNDKNNDEEESEEEEEEEEEEERPKKQLPGAGKDVQMQPLFSKKPPFTIKKGYLMSDVDHLYKIQGTNFLKNRCEFLPDSVRQCYFVCIYAIMMVIHFPLHTWDYRKVDICIERGLKIFSKFRKFSNYPSRNLEKVLVDNNYYNLFIKQQAINLKKTRTNLARALEILLQSNNKYLLLQFTNCSYVIYCDESFHLFDPYPTLEKCTEDDKKVKIQDSPKAKAYPDKNTASWILFPDIKNMLNYLKKRTNKNDFDRHFFFYIVHIISFKKAPKKSKFANFMMDYPIKKSILPIEKHDDPPNEEVKWLDAKQKIIWSRLNSKNVVKDKRRKTCSMWKEFDIEIPNDLYSLWGTIHPYSLVFGENRGKQILAIDVIACLMANIYRLDEWNQTMLDTIVIKGNNYFKESIEDIEDEDYPFSLEDLETEYIMNSLKFNIYIEAFIFGTLYGDELCKFNLARALKFFFEKNYYGILQCMKRCLAIGRGNSGYFMYDCQTYGGPLFANNQGCSYVLKCMSLKRLLHSIIMTLNIPYYNIDFTLHCVRMIVSKVNENDDDDEDEEEEEGDGKNGDNAGNGPSNRRGNKKAGKNARKNDGKNDRKNAGKNARKNAGNNAGKNTGNNDSTDYNDNAKHLDDNAKVGGINDLDETKQSDIPV